MTCGTLYLVFRFTYCICGNLTTAELLNKRKYAYLRDPEDGFCNRFDQGMTANCITFWTSGEKQWRAARAPALVVRVCVVGVCVVCMEGCFGVRIYVWDMAYVFAC